MGDKESTGVEASIDTLRSVSSYFVCRERCKCGNQFMKDTLESGIARFFGMSEATWERHANPWSVWTRYTVFPFLIISIWSRTWFGFWSIPLIVAAVVWTWINPRVFAKPGSTDNWASRSVLGERVWLNRRNIPIPKHHRTLPIVLGCLSGLGLPFVVWGLWQLVVWPTLVGCIFVYTGKLWFLDRMVWLYQDMKDAEPKYAARLYGNEVDENIAR